MTGTDYNAIVNEINQSKPVRPKGQPTSDHAIGSHRLKMKIANGNGAGYEHLPYTRYRGDLVSEAEKNMNKHRTRNAAIKARKRDAAVEDAIKPLSEIFTG